MSTSNTQSEPQKDSTKPSSTKPHEVALNKTIYQFKIILIGQSGVGKTSLVNRFMGYEFQENYTCTINADFKMKSLSIDPSTGAELTIWDTCGQERFRSLTRQYYKDAHGIILVYDVADEKSFKELDSWLDEIRINNKNDVSIVLVGNKIDLENRVITKEQGKQFADKNGVMYIEASSKDGINVESPFEDLANDIIKKLREKNGGDNMETEEDKIKKIGERNEIERQREKEVRCC